MCTRTSSKGIEAREVSALKVGQVGSGGVEMLYWSATRRPRWSKPKRLTPESANDLCDIHVPCELRDGHAGELYGRVSSMPSSVAAQAKRC